MSERYEGDYGCEVSEGERCAKEATQCWREPFTPSAFPVIADQGATAQLARDRELEAERMSPSW